MKTDPKAHAILRMLKTQLRAARKRSRESYLRKPGYASDRYYRAGEVLGLEIVVELASRIIQGIDIKEFRP